jgi:hypothetical protein
MVSSVLSPDSTSPGLLRSACSTVCDEFGSNELEERIWDTYFLRENLATQVQRRYNGRETSGGILGVNALTGRLSHGCNCCSSGGVD